MHSPIQWLACLNLLYALLVADHTAAHSMTDYLSLWSVSQGRIAAFTSRCHAGLSIAHRLAVARSKLSRRKSSSTVLSQVCLGLPILRRQSLGGPRTQARRARE